MWASCPAVCIRRPSPSLASGFFVCFDGRRQTAVHPSGYGGAGPSTASALLADAKASPSSRFLASGPAALVTPSHTLFQQPARRAVVVLAAVLAAASALAGEDRPIILSVDATDAARRVFHVRECVPVSPGPVTLAYPKWIPGERGAEGPITDLVGLRVSASGKPLPWKREPREMWNFDVVVPEGATSLDIAFDYVASSASYTTATAKLAWINWWSVLL